jgi:hypothetical protein
MTDRTAFDLWWDGLPLVFREKHDKSQHRVTWAAAMETAAIYMEENGEDGWAYNIRALK